MISIFLQNQLRRTTCRIVARGSFARSSAARRLLARSWLAGRSFLVCSSRLSNPPILKIHALMPVLFEDSVCLFHSFPTAEYLRFVICSGLHIRFMT